MRKTPLARESYPLTGFCPLYHRAVEIIGRRWSGAILRAMLSGDNRFGQLRSTIPGLSDRLLSQRLKELEGEGLVERCVVNAVPLRIEYRLTAKGEALAGAIGAISEWAEEWLLPAKSGGGRSTSKGTNKSTSR